MPEQLLGRSSSDHGQRAPIDAAGPVSTLFFGWVSPLISVGAKRPLEQDDLLEIGKRDKADGLCRDLEREWRKQLQKKKPSLLRASLNVFARTFLLHTTLPLIISVGVSLVQPLFLGILVDYFTCDTSVQDAYIYAAGFIVISVGRALVLHIQVFVSQRVVGLQFRTALTALIHKKVLELRHSVLLKVSTGHIVNLVSSDVQRFDEVAIFLSQLWWGPVITMIVLVLIAMEIGYSVLAGFALLPIIIMLQYVSAKKMLTFRDRTAKQTDKRIHLMNEIITGMQLIKMYTWEKPFHKVISAVRRMEVKPLWYRWITFSLNSNLCEVAIPLMAFACFTTYVYLGNELTPKKVFTVLSLLSVLRIQVLLQNVLAINLAAECMVALWRMQEFLLLVNEHNVTGVFPKGEHQPSLLETGRPIFDLNPNHISEQLGLESRQHCIDTHQLCASWDKTVVKETNDTGGGGFGLHDLSFAVTKGELLAVVGTVGAGKTSLLMALLGELGLSRGECDVRGDIGYSAQLAWVFSGTLQENILFGRPLKADWYNAVLSSTGLDKDMTMLSHGDQTLVGERGVKLSGGQKARISLARALYRDAEVYLLDDPLSAVDAEVGRQIFDKCIRGLLKDKAVILVTHQLQYLSEATRILVLDHGRSLGLFTFNQLLSSGLDIAQSLVEKEKVAPSEVEKKKEEEMEEAQQKGVGIGTEESDVEEEQQEAEDRAFGSVKWNHYWRFIRSGSSALAAVLVLVLCVLTQASLSVSDWWLAYWSTQSTANTTDSCSNSSLADSLTERRSTEFYVLIWAGLIVVSTVLAVSRGILLRYLLLASSSSLHDGMLTRILKVPMLFFDTNPSGRVLNRFAKDVTLLEIQMPWYMYEVIIWSLVLSSIIIFLSVVNPWTLIVIPPLTAGYIYLRRRYVKSSREVKRLEAIARSPVFSQFSATLQGLTTIRAFHAGPRIHAEFCQLLDAHSQGWLSFIGSTRWLSVRLEMLSSLYLTVMVFASLLAFSSRNLLGLDAGTFGLSLTYLISLYGLLQWVVRVSADTENLMTSAERIFRYCELETEAEPLLPIEPPADWPQHGEIVGKGMTFRYSPDGPAVLKALDFSIRPKEKVGIVGRTGAGKSSFINALFRLSPTSGTVMIDGVALDQVLLETMREKMSIIPQSPVLYSGTLRYNLDPFGTHVDEELWNAIDMVQLKGYVSQLQGGLSCELSESGSNFSVGQRQLICLARALLNRNRILLIDEATANVDNQTDAIIQETLRTRFVDCTVLTIAHRLNTIMDADRIMVIDGGEIVQFDEPLRLLEGSADSVFSRMVHSLGEEDARQLHKACRQRRI